MEHPKFVIKQTDGQYYFHLTSPNAEVILNSELFTGREPAVGGVVAVKQNALHDERYGRRKAHDGQHYFVLKTASGEVIGMSDTYRSKQAMESGIDAVKKNALLADVEG